MFMVFFCLVSYFYDGQLLSQLTQAEGWQFSEFLGQVQVIPLVDVSFVILFIRVENGNLRLSFLFPFSLLPSRKKYFGRQTHMYF